MVADLSAARAFVAVATAGGFRDAAQATGISASSLSGAVKRLEDQLGLRLLNRTTRSVVPTEAGAHLLERLQIAMADVEAALERANDYRETPNGTIRLNVPVNAARLVLPRLLPGFMAAFPYVRVEVVVEHGVVDILAAGCDAGIRYDERLTKNMVAVPIGPRRQRFATAASPAYLAQHGHPRHPNDLLDHACLPGKSGSGAIAPWEFERDGESVRIEPTGALVVDVNAMDLAVSAAIDGCGVVQLFEEWLMPALDSGALQPVLEPWWQSFSGPFLYYHGREHVPAPLKAFIDYAQEHRW
ncbi:LysR family transcriptional regulator [Aurantimonas sp. VKM B-3413]|uniref:LysR family transcriptional regulator n=1 Tax=Aurantimonas sp. VKM B-3413 TaxID=2779401 RepID=UPI001E37BAD0|nr:LysR family transcriptional regulator [Aurantimonas sp. VKM B-3413]MCB8840250.1 LysR family transcriptional regulator [Aurantimonas sp. VKM B-3413]